MKHTFLFFIFTAACLSTFAVSNQVVWDVNSLTSIGGYTVTYTGSPTIISTSEGNAVEFNPTITADPTSGTGDRLQIKGNPFVSDTAFTIEMIFKPYTSATALQPRVFHICHPDSTTTATRTMTMETRYPTTTTGYGDFFVKSVSTSGLIDATKTFATDQWMHMAMTYSNGTLKGYINGVLQVTSSGTYTGLPSAAEVSLGGRMQGRYYFKGAIRKLIFTPQALLPADFTYNGVTPAAVKNVTYEGYELSQNYPNPVKNSTVITLLLPKTETIQLDLYNTIGVKVQTILSGEVNAGSHNISVNVDNLTTGIYYYTIHTATGFQQTRKMLVVK